MYFVDYLSNLFHEERFVLHDAVSPIPVACGCGPGIKIEIKTPWILGSIAREAGYEAKYFSST